MPDTLPVDVNREEIHSLAVPNAYEATGSFDIEISNHGKPLHVHLHLDDDLSSVASLEANNHYVEEEASRFVHIDVNLGGTEEVRGKLKVVTAYGATTRYVDVTVRKPEESERSVTVDESLSKPQPRENSGTGGGSGDGGIGALVVERPEVLVLGLGGLALAVAAYAAVVLGETVVVLGALAVLAGVLVAASLLVR